MSTITVPQWRKEFPRFPEADMPAIPEHWEDISWHNDVCPSFHVGPFRSPEGRPSLYVRIFVDWADPAEREIDASRRFCVDVYDMDSADNRMVGTTDDWDEARQMVEREAAALPG